MLLDGIFAISAPLRATIIGTSNSYGAERNNFGWEHHLNVAISLAIQFSHVRSALCHNHWYKQFLRSRAEHFWMGTPLENCNFSSHSIFAISAPLRATIKQFLRSGAERFWMGTPLEHCNFPSHSIFAISAPLRATIIGTSSSYGAERNAFGWEHHLNIAITLAIQYFPAPLRSVPQSSSSYGAERIAFGWEHHLNIAISLAIHYFPAPLRSVGTGNCSSACTNDCGTERNAFDNHGNTT